MNTETVDATKTERINEIKSKLLSYQIPHVRTLLRGMRYHRALLDTSDTGTGKTYTSIALAALTLRRPVVICPKPVVSAWRAAAEYFGVGDAVVVNYERAKREIFYDSKYLTLKEEFASEENLIIFDEVHRCKGLYTQNSKMLIASFFGRGKVLMLSATPASSPIEMRALGFLMGLHNCKNFDRWLIANGCDKNKWGGWEYFGGWKGMEKIRREMQDRTAGMRVADIPEFPTTQIITDPINLNGDAEKITGAYHILQEIKHKEQKDKDNYLVEMLRARQTVETLKLDAMANMAEDAVEQNFSTAIFVNFDSSVDYLVEKLKCYNPVKIVGGQSETERQQAISSFQSNNSSIVICNIKAGGVGVSLHDPNGEKPRYAIISPNFSAIELKQALGRVHRSGGARSIQRIVFVADTIEAGIAKVVRRKINNMEALTDSDLI